MVSSTWRSPRGFQRPGEDWLRVILLDGRHVTRRAEEVEAA
jgi:hypothetical protein